MANPELQGVEIAIGVSDYDDPLVTYTVYWVSPDGEQRSPKWCALEIESGETFSDTFPLQGESPPAGALIPEGLVQ